MAITAVNRKQVLKVLFISLLLDLISFTFILPLFPKLLEFYRGVDAAQPDLGSKSILTSVLNLLNRYKNIFKRPINDRYDIVLLGGALGSLFSMCQAVASPVIGRLSDKHGRRKALLWSMVGNILSVGLWVIAADFRTFLASRIVGGLSEGNVQMALAIATDISDEEQRGSTMALVGAAFSIAFTFGPALGAALSNVTLVASNPFAAAAGFSLFLIVTETIYLYVALPETHDLQKNNAAKAKVTTTPNGKAKVKTEQANGKETKATPKVDDDAEDQPKRTKNRHSLLNFTHFAFILCFSGMEFSLPFMTYDLFSYTAKDNGKMLGFIGLVASVLQGTVTRRLHPLYLVRIGVVSCTAAFAILQNLQTEKMLYVAAALLALTSATVVTGLNSLSSFEANEHDRGGKLGNHRSWGQLGRALGPLGFCSLYWWAGREYAYGLGAVGMSAVMGLAMGGLQKPTPRVKAKTS